MNEHTDSRKTIGKARDELLRFEHLLADLSARFVNLSPEHVDGEIVNALRMVLEFFQVDRCLLLQKIMPDKTFWRITHAVASEDAPPVPVGAHLDATETNPWAYEKLILKREVLNLSTLDDLPAEANADRQTWMGWGIRSNLNIPITIGGSVHYVFAINSIKRERVWPEEFIPRLRLLGEIFGNALERSQNRLKLEEQLRFETTLAEISGCFVNLAFDQVDSEIIDAERRICECLGLDVTALWQWSNEAPGPLLLTHLYGTVEAPLPERMDASEYFPWYQRQMLAGRTVAFSSPDELPAEARRDAEACRQFGIKSNLTIPFVVGGKPPIGMLGFNTTRAARSWPAPLVKRLELVAQIFANALARKRHELAERESAERLSLTTESAEVGLWILDYRTGIFWASEKARAIFGYSPDEAISMERFKASVHPDDLPLVQGSIERSRQAGEPVNVEYRIRLGDGRTPWITSHGRPHFTPAGEPDRLMGVSLDVTQRKITELQLRESQALLSALVDSTADMIWSVDPERFGLLTFNRGLYEYFLQQRGIHIEPGMEPGELLPTEEYAEKWRSFYRRALEERSYTTEYQVYAGTRTLLLSLNRLERDGVVFGVSVFGKDITGRKRADEQLKKQLEEIERLKLQLEKENIYLREELVQERGFEKIIGSSEALNYILFRVGQVASTDATVLILGETGTGKGMVANAIHELSRRKDRLMITVNCAALPANLIESELFGREKGAFTGAHAQQAGRFEVANGGTIFLDEIGELPLELQSKLLRVLQDGEFERLGSAKTIKVDVRVVASTSRDLKEEVRAGRFRKDLFYRLNVFPITIPPLRERADDIPLLVGFFADKYSRKFGKKIKTIPKNTLKILQEYSWPGNVRELEHVVERSVITTENTVLHVVDYIEPARGAATVDGSMKDLAAMEREHIVRVLRETGWRIEGPKGAATILNLNPGTLRSRIKKLGIRRPL